MDTATALTDPEYQFIGCLLWLPHISARRVLAGMRADDLAHPMAAHVLQLVIEVIANDHDPHPVTVYTHAIATGHAGGEHRRHHLSQWLADTYGAATVPALAAHLKTVVLEVAWRRAVAAHATRLAQAAEDSPTDVLAELADDTATADELWTRYQNALDTTPEQNPGVAA